MNFNPIYSWYILMIVGLGLIVFTFRMSKLDKNRKQKWLRRMLIVLILVLVSFRITYGQRNLQSSQLALNIYFVIDNTPSMGAIDYSDGQQRIQGVKNDLSSLVSDIGPAYFTLTTFNNQSDLALPITSDSNAAVNAIQSIIPTSSDLSNGSNLSIPISAISSQLASEHKQHPERKQVVIYVSDGEQTTKNAPSLNDFSKLKSLINGGFVFGYGTQTGAKMINQNYDSSIPSFGTDNTPYIENQGSNVGQVYISHFDPNTLQTIASNMGIKFQHRTNSSGLKQIADSLSANTKFENGGSGSVTGTDIYWLLMIPGFGLLVWEFWELLAEIRATQSIKEKK